MPDLIRHPVVKNFGKKLDSLRGEFIEPRVKPGMTRIGICVIQVIFTQLLKKVSSTGISKLTPR
jgi:hypothetical protein